MIAFLRNTYHNNKVFIISFFVSILSYTIYLVFRGFGWDGDSFISASQYQKLIGSDIYGMIDGGAHPKILTVLLFGLIYQYTGGFFILTIVSIVLNTLMITTINTWIFKEKGIWLIALTGILINIPWTKIVVNCDNPAFSLPFIVFGIYYLSKDKNLEGALLLIISSLFRSGAEFIIIIFFLKQLHNKNLNNTLILGFAFILAALHTYWGYLLIYPTKEQFWKLAWEFITTPESIDQYQYSLNAFIPYLSSITKQLFNKYSILFVIPAIGGVIRLFKNHSSLRYIILIPIASFILPISSFIYGTAHTILETKHMSYTILLPVLAAFSIDSSILNKIGAKLRFFLTNSILILIILFSAFTGQIKKGDYEAHINGTGTIGWTNLTDIKEDVLSNFDSDKINILTAYRYLTFTILDIGEYAENIDVVRNVTEFDLKSINKYDLIIIPKLWSIDSKILTDAGYVVKSDNNNFYIYYIFSNNLINIQ